MDQRQDEGRYSQLNCRSASSQNWMCCAFCVKKMLEVVASGSSACCERACACTLLKQHFDITAKLALMHEIYIPCEVSAFGGASCFEVRLDVFLPGPSSNHPNPLSGRRNMIVCQQWHVLRLINRSDRSCGIDECWQGSNTDFVHRIIAHTQTLPVRVVLCS